jgi:SH3-like domain-containing protein
MRFALFVALLVLCACMCVFGTAGAAAAYGQAGPGVNADVPCDISAYVADRDPDGLNVRSGPGSTHKVVGNLPNQKVDGGIGVHITGSSGDWFRIDEAFEEGGEEERVFFKGVGWVYGPLLGADGVGGGTVIYREMTVKSRVLTRVPGDSGGLTLRGCRGRWTYVEYKKVKGWAAPGTLCTNSLTTCS